MKAAVLKAGEDANYIAIQEEPVPEPKGDEVLVRVKACTINYLDKAMLMGQADKASRRLKKRSNVVTGSEISGIVQSDGKLYKTGDEVIAAVDYNTGVRAHAEYTVIPEKYLGYKPKHWTHEQAAASLMGLMTAIEALERQAKISEGQSVMIHGASGGVGAYAVQLARYHKCDVTGTASALNMDFVKKLGANKVIDYNTGLPENGSFDIIFDSAGLLHFTECKHLMHPKGVFITTQPMKDLGGGIRAVFSGKKWAFLYVAHSGKNRLARVIQLAQHNIVQPVVDSVFPLDDITQAFTKYINESVRGRIVIQMP